MFRTMYLIELVLFLATVLSNVQSRVNEIPDDKWVWDSYNPTILKSFNSMTDASFRSTEENPCERVLPTGPDYRAPGRRISAVKCFEYIWSIKDRENKEARDRDCTTYKIKKEEEQGIYGSGSASFGIGGHQALPGEFPHMGAIGWESPQGGWIFKCGGSLISEKFVLTAGHCSKASDRDTSVVGQDPKIVRLADRNILDRDEYHFLVKHVDAMILRFIIHPKYDSPKKYFDIALIELASALTFSDLVQPACLYTGPDNELVGKLATMTGWGVIETATRTSSPEALQAVELDVLNSNQCDNLLQPSCNRLWCGMQEHQLCAGKLSGGADACQGDSGGPLQIPIKLPQTTNCTNNCRRMHYIIGVTSFGVGCALTNLPGVYTRVSSFIDWIEGIVWK